MKTGIVVNNYDTTYKNRIQVRLYDGHYMEKIGDQYTILDDDLPWAMPAPSAGGSGGTYAIPAVGSRVYVDGSGYKLTYYGQVEVKEKKKKMMHENADQSDQVKFIAYNEDFDGNDKENYVKIYYIPNKGLTIECMDHKILLTKCDGIDIQSKEGCEIEMDKHGDINIVTANNINLKCGKLNLTEGSLDEETTDRIILGSRLQDIFNNHIHFAATPGGVTTTEPIEKIKETDFSKNIRISKGDR